MADERKREAAPAHEMTRPAAELLSAASATGDSLTIEHLREQLGVGHDDLMGILDQLRQHGKAVETAPGEWSGPDTETDRAGRPTEAPDEAEGRVRVSVGTGDPEEDELPMPAGTREATVWAGVPTVRLTRSIADRLDESALGQIVKAGLEDLEEDEGFSMEIAP